MWGLGRRFSWYKVLGEWFIYMIYKVWSLLQTDLCVYYSQHRTLYIYLHEQVFFLTVSVSVNVLLCNNMYALPDVTTLIQPRFNTSVSLIGV